MYYRNYEITFGSSLTPAVRNLIIANLAVYVLQVIRIIPLDFFGLVPAYVVQRGFIWQLGTYMFLHGGFFHIFFNMFVLWMFGTEIERHWGRREFYKYYFITGIGAALFNIVFEPSSLIPIVGASGAIYGILLAFGLMFPNRPLLLFPFFIPIKAKYFVLIFGTFAFFSAFSSANDGVAHFAHLGGMVVGFLYLRLDWRLKQFWSALRTKSKRSSMQIHRKDEQDIDDFKDRIDKILDKINEVGYHNITDEEKEILKQASKYYLNRKD